MENDLRSGVVFVVLDRRLEESLTVTHQVEMRLPCREVSSRSGFEITAPASPIVAGFRGTEGGLGDADEEPQDRNPLMRRDGEIRDLGGVGEDFVKADGGRATVEPADGNPRI